MLLVLNVEEVRSGVGVEASSRLREADGRLPEWRWIVCPDCCWVSRRVLRDGAPLPCPRAATGQVAPARDLCGPAVPLDGLSPRVASALESALRLGGTNAVIEVLNATNLFQAGLSDFDPNAPVDRDLSPLARWRLDSLRPPRRRRRKPRR